MVRDSLSTGLDNQLGNNMMKNLQNLPVTFIFSLSCLLLFSVCSAKKQGQVEKSVLIQKAQVGSIKIGMSKEYLLKSFPTNITFTNVMREGLWPALLFKFLKNRSIILELDEADNVWAIRILDSGFRTDKDIGVGSTFKEIKKAYPQAKLYRGFEEGPYVTLVEKSINVGFSLDTSRIGDDWISAKEPDLKQINNVKVNLIMVQ